jgi:hypothetical protein
MKTKHAPYSLYKKTLKDGSAIWYARYWNAKLKKYGVVRSTGILAEGKKGRIQEVHEASRIMLAEIDPAAAGGVKLLPFLAAFWNAAHPYFEEMEITRSRKPSAKYIRANADVLRLHVEPFAGFQDITVNTVKAPLLRDWVLYLAHKGASKSLIKSCRQAISVPLAYLVTREELAYNPMERVKPPRVDRKEKGILTSGELTAIAHTAGIGAKARLTVLLGALCGMRLGEICGLRWENITEDTINIHIQWQDGRGLQPPSGVFRYPPWGGSAPATPPPSRPAPV